MVLFCYLSHQCYHFLVLSRPLSITCIHLSLRQMESETAFSCLILKGVLSFKLHISGNWLFCKFYLEYCLCCHFQSINFLKTWMPFNDIISYEARQEGVLQIHTALGDNGWLFLINDLKIWWVKIHKIKKSIFKSLSHEVYYSLFNFNIVA